MAANTRHYDLPLFALPGIENTSEIESKSIGIPIPLGEASDDGAAAVGKRKRDEYHHTSRNVNRQTERLELSVGSGTASSSPNLLTQLDFAGCIPKRATDLT